MIKNIYTDPTSDPDQEYIYLYGRKRFLLLVTYFVENASFCLLHTFRRRKRFLLPVTYFQTNLVYPFTLRVTKTLPSACYILSDMGSQTLPSACYILSDGSSILLFSTSNRYNSIPFYSTSNGYIPFYSTSNGYNNTFTLRVTGINTKYFTLRVTGI